MGIEDRVRQVGLDEFPVADRVGEPAVVGLAGKIEDPSPESRRRRARGQVGTSLSRQVRLGQIRRGAAQFLVLLFQQPQPLPEFPMLGVLGLGYTGLDAVGDVRLLEPAGQIRL